MHDIRNYTQALATHWHDWHLLQRRLGQLGNRTEAERENAIQWFLAQGEQKRGALRRALRGAPARACGAAVALDRMGDTYGVRFLLRRADEEEWLFARMHREHPERVNTLRWLSPDTLQNEFDRALQTAEQAPDLPHALAMLTLALSALRTLNLNAPVAPDTLERGLRFGHDRLRRIGWYSGAVLALNITNAIREEATQGLLLQYRSEIFPLFREALKDPDLSVVRSTILAMRRTGDSRAVSALHPIAFRGGHPHAETARNAIARLLGADADPLILLRSSQNEISSDELLRPVTASETVEDGSLLRATHVSEAGDADKFTRKTAK